MLFSGVYGASPYGIIVYGRPQISLPASSIVGGHFLPKGGKHKRTLSNLLVLYEKAQALPQVETQELRQVIAEVTEQTVSTVPVFASYDLLKSNEKFLAALENIERKIALSEQEDEELLLMAIMACAIH